eukprot:TRINITY_DN5225_c0_g1_i4.p1 TRINITY_DN5225_c0_g1~~TRINITY_DN5225_c0_g1_i4.p1  ORF type:complete len:113 (-),score=57.93 TRINITY_DN5225_c0_g1_i4:133-471(-)
MDSDFDDDMDDFKPKKKVAAKKAEKPKVEKVSKPKADKPKAAPKKKKTWDDSDDDKPKAKKKAKKSYSDSESEGSDMEFDTKNIGPARDRPGRARQAVNYGGGDSDDGDSDF